jgi:hypothetical protein
MVLSRSGRKLHVKARPESGLGAYPGLVKHCPQVDGETSLRLVPAEFSSYKAN